MSYVYCNPNPANKVVGDCVIRAISILLDMGWDDTYDDLVDQGKFMKDMPSSNSVWAAYLKSRGYIRRVIPNTCPDCYTIRQFAFDHPIGEYLLATGSHVVAVIHGSYFDTWDSGDEIPICYWEKERYNARY